MLNAQTIPENECQPWPANIFFRQVPEEDEDEEEDDGGDSEGESDDDDDNGYSE